MADQASITPCPVERLALRRAALYRKYEPLAAEVMRLNTTAAAPVERHIERLLDRVRGLETAATFETPRSVSGALLLVALVYADAVELADLAQELPEQWQQRRAAALERRVKRAARHALTALSGLGDRSIRDLALEEYLPEGEDDEDLAA